MKRQMRNMLILVLLLPFLVQAENPSDAIPALLKKMVNSEDGNYIAARDNIVAVGEAVLPYLKKVAVDMDREWRERLAARICFERILKSVKIMEFRNSGWAKLHNKNTLEKNSGNREGEHVGLSNSASEKKENKLVSEEMRRMMEPLSEKELVKIQKRVKEERLLKPKKPVLVGIRAPISAGDEYHHLKDDFIKGLHILGAWYYFIELTWKNTGETAINCELGESFDKQWVEWCRDVVRGQPEEIWLCRAIADHLRTADFSDWREQKLYSRSLHECGCPELIPVLCARYEDFYKAIISGSTLKAQMEQSPDRYRNDIEKLMKYADKRHFEALSKLINKYPVFASLRPKLQDIKERSASPQPKEVFRIGRRIVPK